MKFTESFTAFAEERIEFTNDEIAKTEWYNNLLDKLIEIQNRSPENKRILAEYNPINEEIFRESAIAIYHQAFCDGIESAVTMAPILAPKRYAIFETIPVRDKIECIDIETMLKTQL
jgi:hypothetical protein